MICHSSKNFNDVGSDNIGLNPLVRLLGASDSRVFHNKPEKLTGSEIKLYFDFNKQKTIRCGRGAKRGATANPCFGAGD
jgi:hypothetical protein